MQYWSTPKKLIALFGGVGVVALALLFIIKPMLSSETVSNNPESTVDSTSESSDELQKPTKDFNLSDVDAENFSKTEVIYLAYAASISEYISKLTITAEKLSALAPKVAKDPKDNSIKKESEALAKELKQEADVLIALEVDPAVKFRHDTIVIEARNIILASEGIVANFADYKEYDKSMRQYGEALEKIANIQSDYLAKIEKAAPQVSKPTSKEPNTETAPVE